MHSVIFKSLNSDIMIILEKLDEYHEIGHRTISECKEILSVLK